MNKVRERMKKILTKIEAIEPMWYKIINWIIFVKNFKFLDIIELPYLFSKFYYKIDM